MARINIPFLVSRTAASGKRSWYWQPSAHLARAGWKPLPLGADEAAAIDAARKRNIEVERWKAGGERPREVRAMIRASTVSALIARYKDAGWPKLSDPTASVAASTREGYRIAFDKIERWAGDHQIAAITPARVRVFRNALLDGAGHTVAFNTLSVLRTLFKFAEGLDLIAKGSNPASSFGLAAPPPRQHIWDEDGTGADLEAFGRGAEAIGAPELVLAVDLFIHLGQREADMLKLDESKWREVKNLPREVHEILVSNEGPDAGKALGFYLRQGKTMRWVGVPIAGDLRRRVEEQIARNRARPVPVTTLLVDERTGRPWRSRFAFITRFNEAKDWAVADLRRRGQAEAAERLDALQIRDFRRTAVVRMGELNLEDQLIAAVTGHRLGTVQKILEVYMPRTTKMAARAVVARMADHKATLADARRREEQR